MLLVNFNQVWAVRKGLNNFEFFQVLFLDFLGE